jgi:hypothetical protein
MDLYIHKEVRTFLYGFHGKVVWHRRIFIDYLDSGQKKCKLKNELSSDGNILALSLPNPVDVYS